MASWKKVIVSGSHAHLAAVTASKFVGALEGNADTATTATTAAAVSRELTVDNSTLNYDSGTTYDGSTARTISIKDDGVTYAKIQNVSATNRILGRDSAGAGVIEEITPANLRTMINVEDGATGDQSDAEIRTAVEAATDSNVFTDADHTKLNGIEASADVTDTANVKSALNANLTSLTIGDSNDVITVPGIMSSSKAIIVGDVTASGDIRANAFVGDGSGLTGLTSPNNSTISIAAGDGLKTGGSFTLNQSGGATVTLDFDASDVAGDGLGTNGEDLKVNVDDSSIEIATDTLRVKAGGIENAMLANDSISLGGVSVDLGASDATPAFNLADSTGYQTSNLSGTITNAQLAGSIAASKLAGSIGDSKLSTISTANKVSLSALDIDGATALGAAPAGADLIPIDDGAGGTNKSMTVTNLQSFMQSNLTFTTNTDDDVSVTNLKTRLAGGFSSNAVQIGDSNDVVTIGNKLVVTGDLEVQGATTTVDTTNLNVTDQWINLNDGGSAADGGFVVEGAAVSFGWDQSAGRWGYLSTGAAEGQTAPANDAFASQVVVNDNVAAYRKNGNIRVESDEIYIYVE